MYFVKTANEKKEMVHNGFFLCTGCNNERLYFICGRKLQLHK